MKLTISKKTLLNLVFATLMPSVAFASADIANVLCNAVYMVEGPAGSAIATLAIIVIGIGALMGKVSWGMAIIVGVGIGVIFGAPAIIDEIAGFTAC